MKRRNFLVIVSMLTLLIFPNMVLALGQMTEPIQIKNALRGESIEQELIAVNSESKDIDVIFISEGDIAKWVNFYLPDDLDTGVDTFLLPASGSLRVVAIINIPEGIANGDYEGSLSVSNIKSDEEVSQKQTGSDVLQKIDRQVSITISDQEEVDIANTSVIPNKFDLEINEPLSIRINYDNQGNIRLSPQIRLKIKKDDQNVHDLIYPYPEGNTPVNPNSLYEIDPLVIQTIGWEEGKYKAVLEFSRGNEVLLEKDFSFSIAKIESLMDDTSDDKDNSTTIYLAGILVIIGLFALVIFQHRKK